MNIFLHQRQKSQKGFTLIELLVVIAIIGLLSSVVLASLDKARAKARDSYRLQSAKSLITALELYRNDFGRYPGIQIFNQVAGYGCAPLIQDSALTSLVPKYIPRFPVDPGAAAEQFAYFDACGDYGREFYAIRVNYETKSPCYVCEGPAAYCPVSGSLYWSMPKCQ